jgi:hypothetical protein
MRWVEYTKMRLKEKPERNIASPGKKESQGGIGELIESVTDHRGTECPESHVSSLPDAIPTPVVPA